MHAKDLKVMLLCRHNKYLLEMTKVADPTTDMLVPEKEKTERSQELKASLRRSALYQESVMLRGDVQERRVPSFMFRDHGVLYRSPRKDFGLNSMRCTYWIFSHVNGLDLSFVAKTAARKSVSTAMKYLRGGWKDCS